VVNNWNIIESGIKHEPPDLHAYSKGVVNNWYIIESGKKRDTPQTPCLLLRCGKWLKQYWKWHKTWASWTPMPTAQEW
jgi:hypothetical protein